MTIEELLREAEDALLKSKAVAERQKDMIVDSKFKLDPGISDYAVNLRAMYVAQSQAYSQLAQAKMQYDNIEQRVSVRMRD